MSIMIDDVGFINTSISLNVTKKNPVSILYVTTDNTAVIPNDNHDDGAIRIVFTPGETEAHIEKKASGVYNDDSFRFASGSVHVGGDLIISGTAGLIETRNPSGILGHVRGLIPYIQFDDDGTKQPQTPILKAEEEFDVYAGEVSEVIANVIGINLGVSPGRVLEESIHVVGSVSATAQVVVQLFDGVDNTGAQIDRRVLPASDMLAGATLEIRYDNDMGFQTGEAVFMQFSSENNISLKVDANSNPLTKHEAHELNTLELLTNNMMRTEEGFIMLTSENRTMFARQFR